MSQLKRNIVRRDKAYTILQQLQNHDDQLPLLKIEQTLLAIIKDIPVKKMKISAKMTPEWQTLTYVATSATLAELWDAPIDSVQIPENNPVTFKRFQKKWRICQKKQNVTLIDFLNLVKNYDVV